MRTTIMATIAARRQQISTRTDNRGRRKLCLLAGLVLAFSVLSGPVAQAADVPESLKIPWGPFLQDLRPTGVNVVWCPFKRTDDVLEYGSATDKLDHSVRPGTDALGRASITGLEPGQTYYYRVKVKAPESDETGYSDVASFVTPRPDVTDLSFAVVADTHTSGCNKDLAALMAKLKPDFVLNGGDRSPSVMSGTLRPYKEIIASVPMYMARGNHDSAVKQRMVSMVAGPGDNQYFAFTWGNARVISVNTEDRRGNPPQLNKGGTQYRWLEEELKNCNQTWKIVFQHIPVFSAYDGGLRKELDDERELLEKYGVDLVFQGHQHNYDRSQPLKDNAVAKDGKGVIYITCSGACGGKEQFPKGTDLWFLAQTYNEGPFLGMVYIDGNKLEFECLGPDKKVIDSLKLQKP